MVLLIDNYDSFVFNLAHYIKELGYKTVVKRNDAITLQEIMLLNPSHIIISPGPGTPDQTGIVCDVIKKFTSTIPLLGICLGHQAIGQVFGAKIIRAKKPVHGKASIINHNAEKIFAGIINPLRVGRYHSLLVSDENFPDDVLSVTARSEEKEIMAIAHRCYPLYGLQFHPESILTVSGHALLKNFLAIARWD